MINNRNVLGTLLWDSLEEMATRPLALVQGASLYCYGVDFNKNVTEVFDAQGTIAAAYVTPPMEQPPAPEDSSSPSSGPARCTTKNPPWPIIITAITTPKTADGSIAIPSLNREDGIFMRSSGTEFINMTHLENLSISSLVALFLLLLKLLFKL